MVINIKWGIVCGGAAFVLAFVTSLLLGQVHPPVALMRALIFLALFGGMGIGIRMLINIFFPELLSATLKEADAVNNVFSGDAAGSQVNITVDDPPDNPALPTGNGEAADAGDVGNFSELTSGAMSPLRDVDQNFETGYNDGADGLSPSFDNSQDSGLGDFSMDFGALVPGGSPGDGGSGEAIDSDGTPDSFSFFSGEDDAGKVEDILVPERKVTGNKAKKMEGDFNAKDIAAGIRTVLEKDKK